MSHIDRLIGRYNGCLNWITYYQERGTRDDAPKHLATLATEQRDVALQIIVELIHQHDIKVSEIMEVQES